MTKSLVSLKQSEALATSWLHRFRTDLFFRTQVLVIGTFFLLCAINLIIIVVSLRELHFDIATTVISILSSALLVDANPSSNMTSEAVMQGVRDLNHTYTIVVVGTSLIVSIIFGYLIARIALAPTRNALAGQKQFVSNIAHELRTPLSIIRANSEILLLQKGVRSDVHTLISSNVEELDRISGIIDNLLTLNTFRHVSAMNFESVNVTAIVRDSVEKLSKLAESKDLTLDTSLTDNLHIWGNKSAVAQIAMNLIKNALVFTQPKGTVTVTTSTTGALVTLEVRDTGIGIEPGNIEKVFEPFYQVEPSRGLNKGSGGLGLAIVSELVKFHQGRISIQSIPSVGTLIRVDFPIHDPETKIEVAPREKNPHANEVTLDFSKD